MKKTVFLLACMANALSSAAQLNNAGFENWQTDNLGNNYLTDWRHELSDGSENFMFIGTYRETNSQQGNYALKLSRWYNYTWDQASQKTAISFSPQSLNGFFSYTEADLTSGKDTAVVQVFLTSWNTATHQPDTVGRGEVRLTETPSYTPFTCPINYSSSQLPDSVKVLIKPTLTNDMCSGNSWCSYLTIDNLSLSGVNANASAIGPEQPISLYPNPARSHVNLRVSPLVAEQPFSLQLTDSQGRLVWQKAYATNTTETVVVPVARFSEGVYTVRVQTPNQVLVQKLVVQ